MFKRLIASLVCLTFSFSNIQYLHAQDFSVNQLPVPGAMIGESAPFAPLALKGLVVNPQKPLEFQFIVDTGKGPQDTATIKDQANQLVKYFLAGLTIPEGDLWVNLSPYEKNRMVPEVLGQTDLGRDLLVQDYILKQLTASLIYPGKDLGKEFWSRVYAKAQAQFGTTNVPVNTFNKVWILPDQAQVFENGAAAYVTKSTLKVMLDEDYTALQKHLPVHNSTDSIGSQIVRQIILPEITKEVNVGRNFAPLRQIYQALILAKWYKETIQNDLLDALYTNKDKVAGVNVNDPAVKEQIYDRYLQAYKKGAFNYIKEDPTPEGQVMSRKYFSGGTEMAMTVRNDGAMSAIQKIGTLLLLTVALAGTVANPALAQSNIVQQGPSVQTQYLLDQLTQGNDREKFDATMDLRRIVDKSAIPGLVKIFENPDSSPMSRKDAAIILFGWGWAPTQEGEKTQFDSLLQDRAMSRTSQQSPDAAMLEPLDSNDRRYLLRHIAGNIATDVELKVSTLHLPVNGRYGDGAFIFCPLFNLVIEREKDGDVYRINLDGTISTVSKDDPQLKLLIGLNADAREKWGKNYDIFPQVLDGKLRITFLSSRTEMRRNWPTMADMDYRGHYHASDHPEAQIQIYGSYELDGSQWIKRGVKHENGLSWLIYMHKVEETVLARILSIETPWNLRTAPQDAAMSGGRRHHRRSIEQDRRLDRVRNGAESENDVRRSIDALKGIGQYKAARLLEKALRAREKNSRRNRIESGSGIPTDRAMTNGGIDLNRIAIHRTGHVISVQFDPAQLIRLEQGGFEGFTPVIESMTRISSPFPLLGVNTPKQEVQLAQG